MAISDADLWHQVHAQREDGIAAMFLIREVEPRTDQPQIFVIEMPYPVNDPSRLPDDAGHNRLDTFQEQWIEPACEALGWTFVAWKSEDGSFFLYLYGDGDPNALLEKLAPFDSALRFFHDHDADWSEYAALRKLVDQSQAAPEDDLDERNGAGEHGHIHTEDCDHEHDAGATSHGIPVVDLTGEPPVEEARPKKARSAKAKPANTKSAAAKPAAAKPANTKPATAKPAAANRARESAATAKTSAKRAAKRPAARSVAKRPSAKPTRSAQSARPTTKAATSRKPAATKAAKSPSVRKGARPRAESRPEAKRPKPPRTARRK